MIGQKKLTERLERVLTQSKADQTEIVFVGNESGLTRYANSYIHQNVFESNNRILFRSVLGKRIGVASTNSLVLSDLRKTLTDSIETRWLETSTSTSPLTEDAVSFSLSRPKS